MMSMTSLYMELYIQLRMPWLTMCHSRLWRRSIVRAQRSESRGQTIADEAIKETMPMGMVHLGAVMDGMNMGFNFHHLEDNSKPDGDC